MYVLQTIPWALKGRRGGGECGFGRGGRLEVTKRSIANHNRERKKNLQETGLVVISLHFIYDLPQS